MSLCTRSEARQWQQFGTHSVLQLFSSPGKTSKPALEECFRILIDSGAQFTGTTTGEAWGDTVLLKAVRQGHLIGCQLLLQEALSLMSEAHRQTGNSVCHEACLHRHFAILQVLLEAGASVNERNLDKDSCVHSLLRGQIGSLALSRSATLETERFLELLLTYGASLDDINAWGEFPIHLPSAGASQVNWILQHVEEQKGNEEYVAMLKAKNSNGRNAIQCAASQGDLGRVAGLWERYKQANISIDLGDITTSTGETILHLCANSEEFAGLCENLLIEANCPVDAANQSGDTALHFAVRADNVEATYALLENGANATLKNQAGLSPISVALQRTAVGSIYALIVKRKSDLVDPDLISSRHHVTGVPLIHRAVEIDQLNLVWELILRGQDVSLAVESDGFEDDGTPLHFAARRSNPYISDLLLGCPSISLNAKTSYAGNTALHLACEAGSVDCVKLLVRRPEVLLDLLNNRGESPLELAQGGGHDEIVQILQTHQESKRELKDLAIRKPTILIFGGGFVGSRLSQLLSSFGFTVYETHRTLKSTSEHATQVLFDLGQENTWANLPAQVNFAIITMAIDDTLLLERFQSAYLSLQVEHVIAYGSTSRYLIREVGGEVTEDTELDLIKERVRCEEYLRSHSCAVLVLAGIYGEQRQPFNWFKAGRISDYRKYLNMIHIGDILESTIATMLRFEALKLGGQNINACDGDPKWMEDIARFFDCRVEPIANQELPSDSKRVQNTKLKTILPNGYTFIDLLK